MPAARGKAPSIALSAHEAFQRPSGIGRYQTELATRLAGRVDLHLLVYRQFEEVALGPKPAPVLSKLKIHVPTEPKFVLRNAARAVGRLATAPYLLDWHPATMRSNFSSRVIEGLYADRAGFDLYHGTGSYLPITRGVRARVITIHDTTPLTLPEHHVRQTVKGFVRPREIAPTDHIIADSKSGLADLLRVVDHPVERTHVIYIGIDHEVFRPQGPAEGGGPYLVSVGIIEPRKNLVKALAAFERLAKSHEDLRWKIVGRKGWGWKEFEAALSASPARDRVDLLGVLTDEELARLYRGARALLYPSVWEGFGIPVAEALACGTAVAASQLPAIEEVGADAFVPLDPESVASIAEAAEKAAFDERERARLRPRGLAQAKKFEWDRSADAHLEVYAQALSIDVAALDRGRDGPP